MSADRAVRALIPVSRPAATPGAAVPGVLAVRPAARGTPPVTTTAHLHHGPQLTRWAWVVALVVAVTHVVVNWLSPYGVHRDELLYLAMGQHLRLWAMDFPPFIAVVAEITRTVAGDARVAGSVAVLRLAPAVAAGLLVLLAAILARDLGGRRGPQVLAAGTVAASPLFLRAGGLFQPVVFDQLWWTVGFLALVRLGRAVGMDARGPAAPPAARTLDVAPRPARRRLPGATWWHTPEAPHWLLLGAAVGFGLLTKFSIAFFAAGALVGVVATPLRRALRTPGPWLAAGLALAIGAPSLVGQLRLGWPVAAQMDDLRASQLARVGPVEFLGGQLLLGPAVLLAVAGLVVLVAPPRPLTVLRGSRRSSPSVCSSSGTARPTTPDPCTRCSGRRERWPWAPAAGARTPRAPGRTGGRGCASSPPPCSSRCTARRRSRSGSRCSPPRPWRATPRRWERAPRPTPVVASRCRRTTPTCSAGPSSSARRPTPGSRSRPTRARAPRSSPATTDRRARSPCTARASGCRRW
jgi:hypothetical protein